MAFFKGTQTAGSGNEGDFIVKPGCKHWRYSLRKEGVSEIRVVPSVRQDGRIEALIDTSRGDDMYQQLSDAVAFFDVVTFLGPGSVSMVCPMVEGERVGPVQTLINAIKSAAKNDPKGCDDQWLSWCGMGPNRKDVMSSPANVAMFQGYLYTHKGAPCMDRDNNPSPKYPVLLQVNRSATREFCEKLSKPKDPNGEWSSDNNLLGDFTDPEHGRMLRFTPYVTNYNNLTQTWYHADSTDAVVPLDMDDVLAVWKPWDEVVNWNPSLPEVGGWLVKAFNASTVVKVFDGHPTYSQCITDTIREIAEREEAQAAGRVQTGYAGYGQQPYYAQQAQHPYPPPPQSQPAVQQPYPPVPQAAPQYAPPKPAAPPAYNPPSALENDEDPDLPFDQKTNVTFRRPRR